MKTIIHVDQRAIRNNRKTGSRDPVITVKDYKSNRRAHSVELTGPSRLVYSPDEPLKCGATVWLVSDHPVLLQ